jgi:hypothetical protein
MVEREGDDLPHHRVAPANRRGVRAEESRRHLGHALAVQIGHGVELGHATAVDPPLERLAEPDPRAWKPLGDHHARQQHRGVVGKEPPIVLEKAQLQALELPVRRENVHDVDLARGQRAIRERVLHHGDARQAQAVVALEPGPPVFALQEARAEGGAQIRMRGEVADGPQAQALGLFTPDRQGIGIGEAQRGTHGQALGFEPGADRVYRGERRILEDHASERARVLRIEVDGPGRERAIRDARAAEARVSLDARLSHRFDDLRRDLGQDIALGEGLRSDADGAVRRRTRDGWSEEQHHRDQRVEDQQAARRARPLPSHGVRRRPARASPGSAR